VLKKALEERIAGLGRAASWSDVIADLNALTETEIDQEDKRFIVRSAPSPAASFAIRATGAALPPTAPHRQRLIFRSDRKNVVPRRWPGSNCRCSSIASPNKLLKKGQGVSARAD
jgi:hypothetical protein